MTTKKDVSAEMQAEQQSIAPHARAVANAKVDAWRAAERAAEAACRRKDEVTSTIRAGRSASRLTDEERLRIAVAEREAFEAKDAAAVACSAAMDALDDAERCECDPVALAADMDQMVDELRSLLAAEEDARAALAAAQQRIAERLASTYDAHKARASARHANGLPPPAPLPTRPVNGAIAPWLATIAMERHAQKRRASAKRYTNELAERRRTEDELRATLELARIKREEAAAEDARRRADEKEQRLARAREAEKERATVDAELRAERDRIASLADAHRARESEAVR
jgi:hypothetical protein